MENTPAKLQQVSALFHDYIHMLRSQSLSNNTDKLADKWLKETKIFIMEEIQRQYQSMIKTTELENAPSWVSDPNDMLKIFTTRYMSYLDPYSGKFKEEIRQLMKECGFHAHVGHAWIGSRSFIIEISFPKGVGSNSVPLTRDIPQETEKGAKTSIESRMETILKITPALVEENDKCANDLEIAGTKEPRRTKARRKRGKKYHRS
ncbi:hypothetical protein H0H87_000584 [Tephrocybe sp. NHM501043]|nr:hypothetical protein H0H87_000584 [Tephrocybe sp. NHM501043]